MSERRPYSRVYWSILEDERFDGVRDKMDRLGSWTLLLVVADMAYPAPGYVPRGVSTKAFKSLCEAGLVEPLPGGRFRLHGLRAERERRAAAATREPKRDPIGTQAGPKREAVGSLAEDEAVDEDETRRAEAPRETDDPVVAYANLMGGYPTSRAMDWIDQLTSEYGHDAVIRALARARGGGTNGVIGRARDVLRAEARELSKREKDEEQAKVQERRVDGMMARRLEWYRNTGQWANEWGPQPEAGHGAA